MVKLVAMTVIRVLLVPNLGTHNTPGLKSSSQQLTRCSGSFARMKIPNDERETGWSSNGLMKSIENQNSVGFSMFFPGSHSLSDTCFQNCMMLGSFERHLKTNFWIQYLAKSAEILGCHFWSSKWPRGCNLRCKCRAT